MTQYLPLREGMPTPLHHAPRLAHALGLNPDRFWIKRDDLMGLGGGGNKVRKLQYSCARAIAAGADTLITTGAPQSNHARLTAAAGARLGLDVILILAGEPQPARGNLLLDEMFGARVEWAHADEMVRAEEAAFDHLVAQGRRPFRIPFGGTDSWSAQGYVDAAAEIRNQAGTVDHVVVAVGSGGTMTGLVRGLGPEKVLGVHCGAIADPRTTITRLLREMAGPVVEPPDLRLDVGQIGDGYQAFTPSAERALSLFATTEGIVLDPTYTGRAAAGLLGAIELGTIGSDDRVVFLHSGGTPALFAHPGVLTSCAPG